MKSRRHSLLSGLLALVLVTAGTDIEMLAVGAMSPLTGFMTKAEYDGVRATWGLAFLTFLGILIAVILILSTNALLIPLKRLQGAGKGKVAQEGINIACEQIEEFKEMEGVAGVHLMAIEWEHKVPEIAEQAKVLPRPEV